MRLAVLELLLSFCPLCVGVAVGGSLVSRFLPGLRMYLINSLWLGFLFFSIINWIYNWFSIWVLREKDNRKRMLKNFIGVLIFLVVYASFFIVAFFLNRKSLQASQVYSFHAGFFAGLTGYEFYHFLFEKGMKVKYGSTLVPGLLLFLISVVYYFA